MSKLASWIARHPKLSFATTLAVTALLLANIDQLRIDASTDALIGQDDPEKAGYEAFIDRFGGDTLTIVVVTPPTGDVFQPETIRLIDEISYAMEGFPGVVGVRSLTTAQNIKGDGEYLDTNKLFEEIPDDPAAYGPLKADALANPTFVGNVVSADASHAAINIRTEDDGEPGYDRRFLDHLQKTIEAHRGAHEIYQVGAPRFNTAFDAYIKRDQVTLTPLAVVVILLALWIAFRSPAGLALPMVASGLSIAATLGFMAWMGFPVNAVTVMVPSVLIVVGCTEDVHLIDEFLQNLRAGQTKVQAIINTARHGALPMTLTALTTALGFFVLALNDIPAIQQFGVVASFGLVINFLFTLALAPALFRWTGTPKKRAPKKRSPITALLQLAERVSQKRRGTALAISTAVIAAAIAGLFMLRADNDPIGFFRQDAPIREDFERVHADMSGAHLFHLVFETEKPGDAKEPAVLRQVEAAQKFLNGSGLFDQTMSLVDFLKLMNREMTGDEDQYALPGSRNAVAEYVLLMEGDALSRYVDMEDAALSVAVRHHMSGSYEVRRALDRVSEWLALNTGRYVVDGEVRNLTWRVTGESVLLHRAADAMVSGQIKSLALAMGLIFLIMCLLFLSVKAGLIAMVSNAVPILLNFGLMGWLGIPFNSGTCLIATIALGVAVDDTIHFMVRCQRCLHSENNQQRALTLTIRREGRPIVITSAALAAGFVTLVFSPFIPTAHFGALAALIMIYALLTDLFLNPALMMTVQLITIWDYVAVKIKASALRDSLIFRGLKKAEAKTVVLLGSLRRAGAGERIVRQGDRGEDMYLILSGSVDVYLEGETGARHNVARLEDGAVFGEMALLGEGVRSATVEAAADTELLRIDDRALERVKRRNPSIAVKLFANISKVLIERVRSETRKASRAD